MAISILCPGCSVQLGLPDEAAGANVGCPRCGTRMLVPSSPPVPPPPRPRDEETPRPRKLVRVPDDDEDEEEDRPHKRRSSDDRPRKKKKKDKGSGIWIGVSVGAGVVVATAILAVFLAQPPEKKSGSDSSSGSSGSSSSGTSGSKSGSPGVPRVTRPALPPGWVEFTHPEEGFSCYVPAPAVPSPDSPRSLRLSQPFQPNEERTSDYLVAPTATQPIGCTMTVSVYGATKPPRPFDLMSRPADTPDIKVTEFQIVTWGGRQASEGAGEHTMRLNGNNSPPKIVYRIGRVQDLPDRLYIFNMQREDRMPDAAERAAFFDSFVPGK